MKYPEHEKMSQITDRSHTISEFLEWLESRRILLCEAADERSWDSTYIPIVLNVEQLLAEYFEIDLDKINNEKDEMLKEVRKINASAKSKE